MTLPSLKSQAEHYQGPLLGVELDTIAQDQVPPKLTVPQFKHAGNGFLSAPLSGAIRPISPETPSDISAEEYRQIRPGRTRRSETAAELRPASRSPAPPLRGWRGRLNASWIRNKGLAYMLGAQVFGTLMNVTTRLLEIEGNQGKGLHPFQILFARMGITVALASGYMYFKRTPHFPLGMPEVRWLLVARGFFGFFGVAGMYWSLLYLPLADATVITFLAPSLACWACSILLKEPFTRVEQLAAFVSLAGVVLIARPTTLFAAFGGSPKDVPPATGNGDAIATTNGTALTIGGDASSYDNVTASQRLFAVGIALVGVLGSAAVFTVIRWIGKRAHPLISVNYFSIWCVLISFVAQLAMPGVGFLLPADMKEWGYLFFLGVCGFVMQFLMAASLAYEKSSRATNITYTQMLFALGLDKLVFGHTPGVMSIIGSSLILGSAIVVAMQQNVKGKETPEIGRGVDEESQMGLIDGVANDRSEE